MMNRRTRLRVTAAWLGTAAVPSAPSLLAAEQPSFDCGKAEGRVPALICTDTALAALDRQLAEVYQAALGKTAADENGVLKAEQRGWIKGRDDCAKSADVRVCVEENYKARIAELKAAYGLVPAHSSVAWRCGGEPAFALASTFFDTDPPAVRLDRGASRVIALLEPSASGAQYAGAGGVTFWTKGDEVLLEWPEGTETQCRRDKE